MKQTRGHSTESGDSPVVGRGVPPGKNVAVGLVRAEGGGLAVGLEGVGVFGMRVGVHGPRRSRLAVIAADAHHIVHLTADATGRQLTGSAAGWTVNGDPW